LSVAGDENYTFNECDDVQIRESSQLLTTDISPQKVLQSLPKSRDRGVTAEHLASALNLSESQEPQLRRLLSEFVRVGLAAVKGGHYWRKQSSGLLIGTFRGMRTGHAFVVPDDERERERGDLYVNEFSMGAALHGDKVIASVTGVSEYGREGRIEAVLYQANPTVVGRFIKLKKEFLVSPIEERFLYEINIAPLDTLGAKDGEIVNVEITRPPVAGRPPWGRVIEVLGREDEPGIDIEIIIRKHRLPRVFPDHVLAEAEAISDSISQEHLAGRVDAARSTYYHH